MPHTAIHRVDGDGFIVGIDPHKRTLTATVLDGTGVAVGCAHFNVSGDGHRALEPWVAGFGAVTRWGIEGAGGYGRHTAVYLSDRGHDVRDVCPNRTADRARRRRSGKNDALDAERIARETLTHPGLPRAFKRAGDDRGPDPVRDQMALWHKARRSLTKLRQQLLNEAEALLADLPEELRSRLPNTQDVLVRLNSLDRCPPEEHRDDVTSLRLRLLAEQTRMIRELLERDREAAAELARLVTATGSTLAELCGLAARSVAELLVEVGDPLRFTEAGFARFNGTAPLDASSGEGADEPVRHRLNRAGNRRVNAILHRMAVTQMQWDERARQIVAESRRRGHTKREALRVLKRHLSNVIYRRMVADARDQQRARPAA